MKDINRFIETMMRDFNVKSYRIKNKNGAVIKLVKNGINMEVEYENQKNIARNK